MAGKIKYLRIPHEFLTASDQNLQSITAHILFSYFILLLVHKSQEMHCFPSLFRNGRSLDTGGQQYARYLHSFIWNPQSPLDFSTARVDSSPYLMHSSRGVQPTSHGPHAAQDGCKCSPTQNHKFTYNFFFFFFAHQLSLVFVYLTCGPRQFLFLQCGPETPKGCTSLFLLLHLSATPKTLKGCSTLIKVQPEQVMELKGLRITLNK